MGFKNLSVSPGKTLETTKRSWYLSSLIFLIALVVILPIEHRYHHWCRFFSLKLIPQGLFLPHYFEKRIYIYPSDILAILFFFFSLKVLKNSQKDFWKKTPSFFVWILFFCSFVSVLLSPLNHYPIVYLRLFHLLTPILFFLCLIRNQVFLKEKTHKIFFISLMYASLFQSVIAIVQYFLQSSIGLRLLNEPCFKEGSSFPKFYMEGGKRWIFDELFHHSYQSEYLFRVPGTFSNPNVLGGFLLVCILSTYTLSLYNSKYCKVLFIQLFALFLTFSRAAIFGWVIGTFFWVLFFRFKEKTFKRSSLQKLLTSIFIYSLVVGFLLFPQILSRGGVVNYNQYAQKADEGRKFYQKIAIKMIAQHPFKGVGFSQLTFATPNYLHPNERSEKAHGVVHNMFFYLAAETGLISLFCLVGIFFLIFFKMLSASSPFLPSYFSILISLIWLGFCDFYLIHSQEGKLFLFTFLAMAYQKSLERKECKNRPLA